MIIIEGLDGVGKTTVSTSLKQVGFEIHHLQYDEKNEKGFMNLLLRDKGNLVLDRAFITEVVYGPVLRNYSRIDVKALKRLIYEYKKNKTKIIYLTALKEDLLYRKRNNKEDYEILANHYDELNKRYDEEMRKLELLFPILRINTSYEGIQETQNRVKEFIRREK